MSIMIIEDSKPMRNLIKRTLKQAGFGDHEVMEAGDGAEGLELIKANSPDLVLCDWNMPKMNGMELLKTLKREGIDVKFGFVTSEQSQEMRDDAKAEGALFLIGKPFTPENFNRELTQVFGKDDAAGTSALATTKSPSDAAATGRLPPDSATDFTASASSHLLTTSG